ncbi:hypothetical protein FHS68_003284 [Dyadobacter arcticus]|uniref:Uncharacterized protein n=1 Tax=Dyadobacter arcticus TaxID=1078754 RepID=A0ABX0UMH1_9BACT|nr:hypothetical protein [Dyadobacter arcticus]
MSLFLSSVKYSSQRRDIVLIGTIFSVFLTD